MNIHTSIASHKTMYSIRRSCYQALQSRTAPPIFTTTTRRAFSQTPIPHRGSLPVYLEASKPELTDRLATTNSRILLPKLLTKEQEQLIYKPRNKARLEADPIEITLGDVTLPLEHIDRNRDIPSRRKNLYRIIELSETKEDWENVLRVAIGYESAGIHLKPEWKQKVVRHLNEAGAQHLILKALQRASSTGISLRDWDILVEVLKAARNIAAQADWEQEELQKALKFAEQVVELMEDDVHLGRAKGEADYRTHPSVIAVPLEMAAELAYRHEGDTARVKKYAGKLMKGLQQRGFFDPEQQTTLTALRTLSATPPSDLPSPDEKTRVFFASLSHIHALIPIWNALSTTRTVLDTEMPMPAEAEATQQSIFAALQEALKALEVLGARPNGAENRFKSQLATVRAEIEQCLDEGTD
ncbi:unnamed protein product [Periconia digitata]|uniref:Uncharacterized protein n=1 Tax=Periconia digitata TaxID=1303443 RepID=A0A9W4XRE1_9PLEO|nr:unnamed protein product [Periconia digitata]